MKQEEEIAEITKQIIELKNRRKNLKNNILKKANGKNNGKDNFPNILRRMSTKFFNEMGLIDDKRWDNGFDPLSLPEKTELIVRHKYWAFIREDMIHFDKNLENQGGILNEKIIQ